jgi:hypothetical protein
MKIAIKHFTDDYRGDHTTDVCRMIDPLPGETVEALVRRVIQPNKERSYSNLFFDRIEIQVVQEAKP